MQPGDILTVFKLHGDGKDWRFVTPICFEDIDARICSAMFRPEGDGGKRADFLVNLTNDGWFKANENADHLQAASFRSIENRVWIARSVNTGISGFIDSVGDCSDLLPVRRTGRRARQIMIDGRLQFYTKFGDVFAYMCDVFAVGIAVWAWLESAGHRSKEGRVMNKRVIGWLLALALGGCASASNDRKMPVPSAPVQRARNIRRRRWIPDCGRKLARSCWPRPTTTIPFCDAMRSKP